MFFIELVVPFLIFTPRRSRMIGAAALALLQVVIIVTGNYTFFNWLTLALCLPLLDDFALARVLPHNLVNRYANAGTRLDAAGSRWRRRIRFALLLPIALVIVWISVVQIKHPLTGMPSQDSLVMKTYGALMPFRSINSYGLFAVMTGERREIVVEGSDDGITWKAYEFRHKPGDPARRPGFVAPHQPRLDWQMWFAALGDTRDNPWFVYFCVRLLQGQPEVLELLEQNPFPDGPPRFIRANLYTYSFTSRSERRETGDWWNREYIGEYLPPISLGEEEEASSPDQI
jgi:hypothetical protein